MKEYFGLLGILATTLGIFSGGHYFHVCAMIFYLIYWAN